MDCQIHIGFDASHNMYTDLYKSLILYCQTYINLTIATATLRVHCLGGANVYLDFLYSLNFLPQTKLLIEKPGKNPVSSRQVSDA